MSDHAQRNRLWVYGIIGLIFVASLLGYGGFRLASQVGDGLLVQANGNPVGGSFRVVSLGGSVVTEGDFRGDWLLVWFVDPRCPKEQCQSPLKALDTALLMLQHEGKTIRPLVVSLDATAEGTDDLKDYVMIPAPHIIPFYATPNMVRAMTSLYQAPLEKEQDEQGQSYYRPAPFFVLMNPQSRYVARLSAVQDAVTLSRQLRQLVY